MLLVLNLPTFLTLVGVLDSSAAIAFLKAPAITNFYRSHS
jgi:hypothetical protein